MVPQDGIEPPLTLYIRQPRCHCATGASIRSLGDSFELLPTSHVAQFVPTRLAEADLGLLIVAELFPASFAFHKLAPRAGFEPAHFLINSQAPCQLGYLGKYGGPSPNRTVLSRLRIECFADKAYSPKLGRGGGSRSRIRCLKDSDPCQLDDTPMVGPARIELASSG